MAKSGEREKEHGAPVERTNLAVLAERQRDAPGKDHHHAGAQRRGQVRVHMRHAHLGQQGRGGGKDGGKQCPSNPAHGNHGTRSVAPACASRRSAHDSATNHRTLRNGDRPRQQNCLPRGDAARRAPGDGSVRRCSPIPLRCRCWLAVSPATGSARCIRWRAIFAPSWRRAAAMPKTGWRRPLLRGWRNMWFSARGSTHLPIAIRFLGCASSKWIFRPRRSGSAPCSPRPDRCARQPDLRSTGL